MTYEFKILYYYYTPDYLNVSVRYIGDSAEPEKLTVITNYGIHRVRTSTTTLKKNHLV